MDAFLKNFDLGTLDLQMILVTVVLFTILSNLLKRFVFQPYIALIEARENATIHAETGARRNDEETILVVHSYEKQLAEERQQVLKQRQAVLAQAKAEAQRIIGAADTRAHVEIKHARDQIAREATALDEVVRAEAVRISSQIAAKAAAALGKGA